MRTINILLCLNRKLFKQLFVLVLSVVKNNASKIIFHIFETDFTDEESSFIDEFINNVGGECNIYHIDKNKLRVFKGNNGNIPVEAYCRLLCGEILPNTIDRVLYLDVDTIVDKPLDKLYNINFLSDDLCACKTPMYKMEESEFLSLEQHKQIRICHFNSGVILFNLENFRAKKYDLAFFERKYKELLEICNIDDPKRNRPYYEDQGLLNYIFLGKVKYVPDIKYNFRPIHMKLMCENDHLNGKDNDFATIIHFTCDYCDKPWRYFDETLKIYRTDNVKLQEMIYYYHKKWWKYASMTPFYNELRHDGVLRKNEKIDNIHKFQKDIKQYQTKETYLLTQIKFFQEICRRLIKNPKYIEEFLKRYKAKKIALYTRNSIADLFAENIFCADILYVVHNGSMKQYNTISKNSNTFPLVDMMLVFDIEKNKNKIEEIKSNLKKKIKCDVFHFTEIE